MGGNRKSNCFSNDRVLNWWILSVEFGNLSAAGTFFWVSSRSNIFMYGGENSSDTCYPPKY